ncbi:hypothetical protein HMI54_000588 [Coelomomyces lativittatus]|nr:hypothetical protein HMI54_000588 [Coelomomyces lativittatus]KAJ1511772.1 hypothetical protein HMI56_004969 [Coelomomyces lativittatus]KAJ1515310.1 hypothetical protein HMI55_003833 [Coelomomyces lativittatus]
MPNTSHTISAREFQAARDQKASTRMHENQLVNQLKSAFNTPKLGNTPNLFPPTKNVKKNIFSTPQGNHEGDYSISPPRFNHNNKSHDDGSIFSVGAFSEMKQGPNNCAKNIGTNNTNNQKQKFVSHSTSTNSAGKKHTHLQKKAIQSEDAEDLVLESGSWLFNLESAPKSFQNKIKQSPKSNNGKKAANQKIKETSQFTEDAFFETGSWLFDLNQAPKWFRKALNSSTHNTSISYQKVSPVKVQLNVQTKKEINDDDDEEEYQFGSWLLDPSHSPEWFKQHITLPSPTENGAMGTLGSVNNHPQKSLKALPTKTEPLHTQKPVSTRSSKSHSHLDDGFYSGAWLFNEASRPLWLQKALREPPVTTSTSFKFQNNDLKYAMDSSKYAQVFETHKHIPLPSVPNERNPPKSGFEFLESGGWLFNLSETPNWFQSQIRPTTFGHLINTKTIQRKQDVKSSSPRKQFIRGTQLHGIRTYSRPHSASNL